MPSSRFSDLGLFELNVVDVVERNAMGAVATCRACVPDLVP